MQFFPFVVTAWILAVGLYGIVTSRHLVHQIELSISRLSNKNAGHREIDRSAVKIKRISGRHDQPNGRFARSEIFELHHQPR